VRQEIPVPAAGPAVLAPPIDIPPWIPEKWQSIVDTVAQLADVPSGLVMRTIGDRIEVFVSSRTVGNPYKPGEAMRLPDSGLYCEYVIRTNGLLAVHDALADEAWKCNPDVDLDMISYLGLPIRWPDTTPFGTLCILDSKARSHSLLVEKLLAQFRDMIEHHLSLIYSDSRREMAIEADRRRHAEALQSSEQRFHLLVEHAADDVILHDGSGRILDANRSATRHSGLGRERLRDVSITDLPIDFAGQWDAAAWAAARPGQAESFEAVYRHADGHDAVVEIRWTCQFLQGDKLFLIFMRDISERQRAEEALRVAEAELARAARLSMMGELAGSIIHEINQPLAAIAARAEACVRWLDRAVPQIDRARASARLLSEAAQDASDIVKGLRAIAERSAPVRERFEINEIVYEALNLTRRQCLRLGVSLQVALINQAIHIHGDRTQIKQVVVNLLLNAADAMRDMGDRPRQLSVSTALRDAASVVLKVEDSGTGLRGLPPEQLFEPLFTTKDKGMGMGLAICRSIAQTHGGSIWAEEREDACGARFYLLLPIG
jgi:PAS domain S-box-containing protein